MAIDTPINCKKYLLFQITIGSHLSCLQSMTMTTHHCTLPSPWDHSVVSLSAQAQLRLFPTSVQPCVQFWSTDCAHCTFVQSPTWQRWLVFWVWIFSIYSGHLDDSCVCQPGLLWVSRYHGAYYSALDGYKQSINHYNMFHIMSNTTFIVQTQTGALGNLVIGLGGLP